MSQKLRHAVIKCHGLSNYMLTEREKDCLLLSAQGKTVKEIAKIFNLSPETMASHTKNIREKLDCTTLTEAIVFSLLSGLVGNSVPQLTELAELKTTGNKQMAREIVVADEKNSNLFLLNNA